MAGTFVAPADKTVVGAGNVPCNASDVTSLFYPTGGTTPVIGYRDRIMWMGAKLKMSFMSNVEHTVGTAPKVGSPLDDEAMPAPMDASDLSVAVCKQNPHRKLRVYFVEWSGPDPTDGVHTAAELVAYYFCLRYLPSWFPDDDFHFDPSGMMTWYNQHVKKQMRVIKKIVVRERTKPAQYQIGPGQYIDDVQPEYKTTYAAGSFVNPVITLGDSTTVIEGSSGRFYPSGYWYSVWKEHPGFYKRVKIRRVRRQVYTNNNANENQNPVNPQKIWMIMVWPFWSQLSPATNYQFDASGYRTPMSFRLSARSFFTFSRGEWDKT